MGGRYPPGTEKRFLYDQQRIILSLQPIHQQQKMPTLEEYSSENGLSSEESDSSSPENAQRSSNEGEGGSDYQRRRSNSRQRHSNSRERSRNTHGMYSVFWPV